MSALVTVGLAVIAAVAAWGCTLAHASACIARLRAEMQREIAHWQDEAVRARLHAAQVARDAATWAKGRQQGREDVMTVLVAVQERLSGPSLAADDISNS